MSESTENSPLASLRMDYTKGKLRRGDLPEDPRNLFEAWLALARACPAVEEANTMALATATADGKPSVRTVLCKGSSEGGIEFFTNYNSQKARDIRENPFASASFYWPPLQKQVCIRGRVEKLPSERSEAYFHSRPYASQIGALASDQTAPLPDRSVLESRAAHFREKYPEGTRIPLPEFWGGFTLVPHAWEFWQGRPSRLHDRFLYSRPTEGDHFTIERLNP